jgi:hypothetical protein
MMDTKNHIYCLQEFSQIYTPHADYECFVSCLSITTSCNTEETRFLTILKIKYNAHTNIHTSMGAQEHKKSLGTWNICETSIQSQTVVPFLVCVCVCVCVLQAQAVLKGWKSFDVGRTPSLRLKLFFNLSFFTEKAAGLNVKTVDVASKQYSTVQGRW